MLQRNGREVVLGSALIVVPGVAVNLAAATLSFDRYQSLSGSVVSVPELLGGARASTGIEELLWVLGLMVNSLATCLVGGYLAALVIRRQAGLAVTISSGYRKVVRRLPALFIAWAIGHSWILIGSWLVRGIGDSAQTLVLIYGSPIVMVLVTMTVVVAPAIVIEGLGPFAGLARSWRLARRSFATLLGFTLASVIVGVVVQYGIAYLPRLLQSTELLSFGRFGWLTEGVAGQIGRLISMPIVGIATTLVYLQIRMTTEGLDLTLDADRVFEAAR